MLQADLEDEQRYRNGIYAIAERLNAAGAFCHWRLLCGQLRRLLIPDAEQVQAHGDVQRERHPRRHQRNQR